jgi:hypothetical protein
VWNDWLKDKSGRMFVATIDGVPVGITHLSIDKPHEVWLSGARTDPNHRRIGVATAITQKCLDYAGRKGAKMARLATESDNIAAQELIKKLGFRPIAEFVEMKTKKIAWETGKNSKWAEETEADAAWNYLQTPKSHRKAAGLYTSLFHWFSLEKGDLKRFIEQQKAILHSSEKGTVDGIMLIDDATAREWHKNTMQTCIIDGNFNAAVDMIRFLKSHCHALGVKKIYGFASNYKPVVTALEKSGFGQPDAIDIVFEKKL